MNFGQPGILYSVNNFLVKDLDVSTCAKLFLGPIEPILISDSASAIPLANGFSGPIIEKLNWDKATKAIICPEDINEVKPSPEGVYKGLKILNGTSAKSYYVGDHERDIETAKNAGVISIACTYGYHENDTRNWKADHVVDSPTDIMEII